MKKENQSKAPRAATTPYYLGGTELEKDAGRSGEIIDVAEVKSMANRYLDRIQAINSSRNVDLDTEDLIIHIDKELISTLLNTKNCESLMAVLAVEPKKGSQDPKNQTMVLIPSDADGNALKLDGEIVVKGAERWPTDKIKSVRELVNHPRGVADGIEEYFTQRKLQ